MKDLFLTPRGDLAIDYIIENNKRLEIQFITSKSNALRLNFYIENNIPIKRSINSLSISFKTNKLEENKELRIAHGNQAMEQAIKIRLSSSLGSIKGNKDIGSRIEMLMHQFIDNSSIELQLKQYIQEAIRDIIPNAEIRINKIKTKYIDYSNALKITIVDKNKKYNIEL